MRTLGSLLTLIVLAGAGSANAAAPAALPACSLIDKDAVAAVVGGKIELAEAHDSGVTTDGSYSSTCLWKVSGLPLIPQKPDTPSPFGGMPFAMLNSITWPAGSDSAKKYLEDFREASKQELIDAKPIPVQAGDEALFWGDGVAFRRGDVSFGISVHVGTDKKTEQALEESLAKKIVANFDGKQGTAGH